MAGSNPVGYFFCGRSNTLSTSSNALSALKISFVFKIIYIYIVL